MRLNIIILLVSLSFTACKNSPEQKTNSAEMYEASELSETMRTMVDFSKQAKTSLAEGKHIDSIPAEIWEMAKATVTRDEHLESDFQTLAGPYFEALRGIERGDSQSYYYRKSIDACKACHSRYCGGPMSIINKLD